MGFELLLRICERGEQRVNQKLVADHLLELKVEELCLERFQAADASAQVKYLSVSCLEKLAAASKVAARKLVERNLVGTLVDVVKRGTPLTRLP